ncbi:homoserine O-succinyltransferase [Wohlfahrtiimonas chitiniclastica]|uniref:homoserine O-succinyltransferase n=1 Tax=Wohlfahrtiimonas chitiniclastica TaxID=400946 RepID=UPI0007B697B0|nr:homoserine O-succinyltransferase [Wohlfahrtiimonas chitiniclastica]KZX38038.1 homoserine O-succinyltransferase [Wohlfahrtiimonas chitiniclastica]
MPVIIPENLPASQILKDHGIFVMNPERANTQDIRPVRICILNLMPDKITAETQLLSKLSNGILQVDITLLAIENHTSKNTKQVHLDEFYRFFSDIEDEYFDGMIITGAPIELLDFEEVTYWDELTKIFEWSKTHVFASLFICWGSQAALKYFYGIEKNIFKEKLTGVFEHIKEKPDSKLLIGMDDLFYVPQSRNTESDPIAMRNHPELEVIASSEVSGIHLVASKTGRQVFMSGHPEYGKETLLKEYQRDSALGMMTIPSNYFKNDDPTQAIQTRWMSASSIFFQNWLNYFVYQETDYDFTSKKS